MALAQQALQLTNPAEEGRFEDILLRDEAKKDSTGTLEPRFCGNAGSPLTPMGH
jgi:hypothetical protein